MPAMVEEGASFIVIDEGELDGSFGFWAEDEDDGAEGFLEAREDIFYIYDEQTESWFQRRFQRPKIEKKAKGGRGGKGRGRGCGGRRFFESRRKKSATTRRPTVNLRTGPGKLKSPGGGKMVGQASQMQQIHGNHGIRNQPMSLQKVTNLKVEARKVRKVRRLRMVETRKALGSCRLHSHGVGGLAVFRGR